MVNEVIILAGGLGTRLSETVPGTQKCMAPVNGHPFLFYILKYLQRYNLRHYIFSLGYRHEHITDFISSQFPDLHCSFSIEESPLGTGGAIQKALAYASEKNILVLNGDTFFNVHIPALAEIHETSNADCTIALKPMKDFNRYGSVDIDENNRVVAFKEKQPYAAGLINGGIYMLSKDALLKEHLPLKFSFEKDYLEKFVHSRAIYAQVHDEYFIDIGIPQDYFRAQDELKQFV